MLKTLLAQVMEFKKASFLTPFFMILEVLFETLIPLEGLYRVKFLQGGFYMEIRQSAEDYLESILVLSKKGGGVRSIGWVQLW